MKKTAFFTVMLFSFLSLIMPSLYANNTAFEESLIGTHPMTLQWIGWGDKAGQAQIYRQGKVLYVDGYQQSAPNEEADFISFDGTLKVVNPRELIFNGNIETRIKFINDGRVYKRKGTFTLKASGNRKYWRMQNMSEPDGDSTVVDYIDIYFPKY